MVNAQEWLDKWYPKEGTCLWEDKYINNFGKTRSEITYLNINNSFIISCQSQKLTGHLKLRDFVNLGDLSCSFNQLTSLDLSDCRNLENLECHDNQFTSVDFLNTLPNPEKLIHLSIYSNKIQATDIAIFSSKFINLERLQIGSISRDKINLFYGSLQSLKNLTKLKKLCISQTDVNQGLEYLPMSLAKEINKENNIWKREQYLIDCRTDCRPEAKCQAIQKQLRPFNYDLLAWQLAHPERMLIAQPELFTNPDSKDKWIEALKEKIKTSQEALNYLQQNEPNKEAKIIRLETQIKILEEVESQLKEELTEEREIHEDAMKAMDNFYQQNPPREDLRLKNILQQFEEKYLKLNKENKLQGQTIKKLKQNIETVEKIVEQEYQPKETEEKETQTELTKEALDKQEKENQELKEKIKILTKSD